MSERPVEISRHLIDAGYRFIKVRKKDKAALEVGWNKDKYYSGDDESLLKWLSGGGNYGVVGSKSLIIIENDRPEILESLGQLPETFTVQSGSGRGLHSYYICDAENAENLILSNPHDRNDNWGNIQSTSKFVVGAGSIHPSGGQYTVIKDIPVATISFDDVKRIFDKFLRKRRVIDANEIRRSYGMYSNVFDSVSLGDVGCYPTNPSPMDSRGEIHGSHPIHGSSTGQNFFINPSKNVWKCFRDDSGGGPLEWLAVSEGIISCDQAGPGCLRGDLFKKVLEIARERGIKIKLPKKETPERPKILESPVPIIDDWYENAAGDGETPSTDPPKDPRIDILDALPEQMPDAPVILIDAPPRLGKTHHVVARWVAQQSKTANVITTSHSIVEQQLRIFKEHCSNIATAVHLEGKDRCCIKKAKSGSGESCKACQHYPFDEDNYLEIQSYVKQLLYDNRLLTKESVADLTCGSGHCPYYILKMAEKFADYCFTVTANLSFVSKRELTFIDEDPSIDHYFASSAPLMEATFHMSMVSASSKLEEKWSSIEKLKTYLALHRPKGKKTILRVIDILSQMRPILTPETLTRKTKQDIVRDLASIDTTVPQPDDIAPYRLIEEVKKYEMNECISPFLEALLFQYSEQRFIWTGNNPSTLHIVAVGDQLIRPVPEGKIVIVGSTRAELFVKALYEQHGREYKVIRVKRFPYSGWFAVIVVKDDNKKSTRKTMEYVLKSLGRTNEEERLPVLVLTGSEKDQTRLKKILGGIAHCSKDENQVGQKWNHRGGYINIFYQNSVISRGIDVDFYNILFIYSSDFANPYWNARMLVAKTERLVDDYRYVQQVIDSIVMDETTNSLLRISPVRTTQDSHVRVVVISEHDLWKVRPNVLEGMRVIDGTDVAIENIINGDLLNERMVSLDDNRGTQSTRNFGSEIPCGDGEDPQPPCSPIFYILDKSKGTVPLNDPEIYGRKPDLDTFENSVLKNFFAGLHDWRKNHNKQELEEAEVSVRNALKTQSVRGWRISEISLINHVIRRAKKHQKTFFTPENIARIISDMVKGGEVIRECGMGPKSKLSLRERYVEKIDNSEQQFDV